MYSLTTLFAANRKLILFTSGMLLAVGLLYETAGLFMRSRLEKKVNRQADDYHAATLRSDAQAAAADAKLNQLRGERVELNRQLTLSKYAYDSLHTLYLAHPLVLPATPPRYRPGHRLAPAAAQR